MKVDRTAEHATGDNIKSYVSLQRNGGHVCGGARMTVDQALTIKPCFDEISNFYSTMYAVFPFTNDESLGIKAFKKANDKFFIIIVSSSKQNSKLKTQIC